MSILKFQITGTTIADLVCLAKTPGNTSNISGVCTDGVYVYSLHGSAVERFLCSDMSFVDSMTEFNGSDLFNDPMGITVRGIYLYVADTNNNRIVRFLKSDFSYVDEFFIESPQAIDHDEDLIYISERTILG